MACDATRERALGARLRRVATGRTVRRLLVLAGLLVAGWILGGMAQQASAAEAPAPPKAVADAPVLATVLPAPHSPIPSVVGAVKHQAPPVRAVAPVKPVTPVEAAEQAGQAKPAGAAKAAPPAERRTAPPKAHGAPRRASGSAAPVRRAHVRAHAVSRPRPASHARHHRAIERHPAPFQAPGQSGTHSVTCGGVPIGAAAGLPTVFPWAPVPPRACVPRRFGAVPPAVRTAADEPSFAPD
ncbi:hypothetical protein [Actinomadura opuntiae]|uniref:hypothetical protein n=1 Tax=Actinomadura sp. OS1-43 TaxID=604315 RepID=UPI00255AAF68|nr:hypothetical protein [Actinomadura sp. OS1-43]MDL4813755.1 hypothetical protein [Actinomadura sp. OS1-43]